MPTRYDNGAFTYNTEAFILERARLNTENARSILRYCVENRITNDELEDAYFLALDPEQGLASQAGAPMHREEVFRLARLIDDLTKKSGLPLDYIEKIAHELARYQEKLNEYYQFVDGLPITDQEKDILKTVVKERKRGTIFLSSRTGKINTRGIPTSRLLLNQNISLTEFISSVREMISEYIRMYGNQIEIRFSEK